MKEYSIDDSLSFNLSGGNIRDLNNNLSSSVSHDLSVSFDNQSIIIFGMDYSPEKIHSLRAKRMQIAEEIK